MRHRRKPSFSKKYPRQDEAIECIYPSRHIQIPISTTHIYIYIYMRVRPKLEFQQTSLFLNLMSVLLPDEFVCFCSQNHTLCSAIANLPTLFRQLPICCTGFYGRCSNTEMRVLDIVIVLVHPLFSWISGCVLIDSLWFAACIHSLLLFEWVF